MSRRRQSSKAGPIVSGVLAMGLFVGTGAITGCSIPMRSGLARTSTTRQVAVRPHRPSSLIQVGDSKTACISGTPGTKVLHEAELATGVTFNCIVTYTDAAPTWADWVYPWIAIKGYAPFVAWVAADPRTHQLVDTQNLIPNSETKNPDWTAECAAGAFDTYAKWYAKNMIAAGFGYAIIRLGHEMNGTWENDDLGTTVASWHQWGQCFAQEVKSMRTVPGGHFLFDWNVNGRYRDIPLADYYPGNAYVDIIGISQYDESGYYLPPVGSAARWKALVSEPMGLNVVYAFARRHHKPLSVPEWATVVSLGDDGNYVAHMGDFFATHDIAYQAWFNIPNDNICLLNSDSPHSVAAYAKTIARPIIESVAR
jgi:hypothetical protein